MKIFNKFKSLAKEKVANLGLGLGEDHEHNLKLLEASLKLLNEYKATIFLFGNENSIEELSKNKLYKKESNLKLVASKNPITEILEYLDKKTIDAVVRGSLSSSEFLKNVKNLFNISEINRLALLETIDGFQFFYGPVGIDECNSKEKKIIFIKKAIKELETLKISPKISILSGGRKGDHGRDAYIDDTINVALEIVENFKKEYSNLVISHDEILIENAIAKKSNLIIAPDGISGNLIYRTLVHLGGGHAYGAIYMDIDDGNKIIIDTSRVGKLTEIYGALLLALALKP